MVFVISFILLALCAVGLCFNIIFRKNGKFPDGEVGGNKELRKRGMVCPREQDERIWGKSGYIKASKSGCYEACKSCVQDCAFKKLTN